VKRQQLFLACGGLLLLLFLFIFGKTAEKKAAPNFASASQPAAASLNIDTFIQAAKQKLSPEQQAYITTLENNISRGDVKDQQINNYNALASFWKDSLKENILADFYIEQSAKLVNSEKSRTFAAQLILDDLRNEPDAAKRTWEAAQAIELFEKAIELDPNNDTLKVGLGSCYVFGKGMAGDAQQTMNGIRQLLEVVRKDSTNMQAQLVLGIGGVLSAQYDKAIDRLLLVVKNDNGNLEAVSWLADAYAGIGDKSNALKWYETSKRMVNNPQYSKEVDERIKLLR
jgi:tetratricopeptide (TPR) repeat protein